MSDVVLFFLLLVSDFFFSVVSESIHLLRLLKKSLLSGLHNNHSVSAFDP